MQKPDFLHLFMDRVVQKMRKHELRAKPTEIVFGDAFIIEVRTVPFCELFESDDQRLGISLVVRQAPEWFLNLRKKFHVTVDGEEWTIVCHPKTKTYASPKRHLHIDTHLAPEPSFIDTKASKYVEASKAQAVVAALNEALPLWKAAMSEQELAKNARRAEYKAITKPALGEDTPLCIIQHPTKRDSEVLKIKLASAPSWLFEHGHAEFQFNGEIWRCVVSKSSRTHVNLQKRKFVINETHETGYTHNMTVAQLEALCAAFNAQQTAARADAATFRQRQAAFKSAVFTAGDQLTTVVLQKTHTWIRLTSAPKWLTESKETFRFLFQDDVWEYDSNGSPWLNAEERKVSLLPTRLGISTPIDRGTVELLLSVINACLPDWEEALRTRQQENKMKRVAEFQRSGYIKRQRTLDPTLVKTLEKGLATSSDLD